MNDLIKIQQLSSEFPEIYKLVRREYAFWVNEGVQSKFHEHPQVPLAAIEDARERLKRFTSYIKVAFPETKFDDGVIESNIVEIPQMQKLVEGRRAIRIPGKMFLKCDHALPISGSIKARGGIYEVLKFAEDLAIAHELISKTDDYAKFASDEFKELFSQYKIAVGSTGNLGLSIGIIGAKLGFQVTVHMSSDAKRWKKDLLREKGVEVIEYAEDYSVAVEQGRKEAETDPRCHFVDDENSLDLFVGYAAAADYVAKQLKDLNIQVDSDHPLFLYLPCGVGGGPGGVAYGMKAIFGEHIHIFFGEPMESPCMMLGMMTGLHDQISVADIGLTNVTEADGLAVGRPSKFVGQIMEPILSGCYTVDDSFLSRSLKAMLETENIFMEPSAHAAVFGPVQLVYEKEKYIDAKGLADKMENATHLVWSTGGNMVPHEIRQRYLKIEM